ncbi:MAG: FtsX-like permease family protein [Coriobacteriales bacterium]|nr:FtsX-like permease family protein [Coriobacteriales bacterium]
MSNPLHRRYPRELRNNLGKYLGLFLMMVFAVSFTSGFLLAAGSIETIVNSMRNDYHIEDGRFVCDFEPKDEALDAVRALGVTLYEDFYKQVSLSLDSADKAQDITARVYGSRDEVNLPCYAQGRAPQAADEIAFDRVFCENHGLCVGDAVTIAGRPATVCGILTFPDYQALFEDNGSFMFNAITFTVAQMSDEGYAALGSSGETYAYALAFDDASLTRAQKTDIEEDIADALDDHDALLSDLIDADDNQGIGYALDDVQGDQAMWTVLLFLLVVIMGFVFAVLTGTTIEQESSVIGTLLASGWRKGELVRHYLLLPALIGLLATCVGLVTGIWVLCDPFKDLYYHSYSLPPYHTIWDWRIVILTAVLPYLLLVGITLLGLARSLRFTPLQFLRHETGGKRGGGRIRLPERLRYVTRFRLRVILRNASHFATLFFGILFASLLLLFGLCMLPVVDNYAQALRQTVAAPHQYVLKTPLELQGTSQERDRYAAALRIAEDHARIERNQDSVDALDRLQDNDELLDALERLQDNDELMDALERLQDNQKLVDVARRLRNNQELLDAAKRLKNKHDLMDAAKRLEDQQDLLDAIERLEEEQDLVDAMERLQDQPDVVEAAQRMAAGAPTPQDMALLAAADDQTRTDLELASEIDEQTQDDIELVSDVDEQTQADLELLEDIDDQTRDDLDLLTDVSGQTRDDLEYLADLDTATRDDLSLVTDATGQTKQDLELLMDLEGSPKDDLELVRDMDQDLVDDLRLADKIDEDAHVVNTQANDQTTIEQAEKYAVASMEVERAFGGEAETISVYGIQPGSAYWTNMPVADGTAVAGRGLIEKTKAAVGQSALLHDPRKGEDHEVRIAQQTTNAADTSLYLSLDDFNRLFNNDTDYFNAWASADELALDGRYVASSIVPEDMDDISNQMRESMGNIMTMMMLMAVPIYLVLVYLLTKTVIDRSARSISYMKVFGYHAKEVDGLYIRPVTVFVLVSLIASIPLIIGLLTVLLTVVFMRYSGNFPISIPADRLALLVVVGMATYAVVAALHVRRIRRVPLSLALKVQE